LARFCTLLKTSTCKKRLLCIDQIEAASIFQFLNTSDARRKSWLRIVDIILEGYTNNELYEILTSNSSTCLSIMNLYYTHGFDRIFCIEQTNNSGHTMIVMAHVLKGTNPNTEENSIILNQLEKYEYEILGS